MLHRFQQCAVPGSSFDFSFLVFRALNVRSVIGVRINTVALYNEKQNIYEEQDYTSCDNDSTSLRTSNIGDV